ncbi:MAG: glycosyltransferase family 4 protein [Phycisphaeraceae bacterium]|nr:glycosyltransferase family 4 protein [Phycisphaeraceae bacterium]
MTKPRALWLVREDLDVQRGGDTVQVHRTKSALEQLGVRIELRDIRETALDGFDVVHLWHLDRLWETLPICRRLERAAAPPGVLSTIYWPSDEFDRRGRHGLQGWLARRVGTERYQSLRNVQHNVLGVMRGRTRVFNSGLLRFRAGVRSVLDTVRVILPNSIEEKRVIEQRFGATPACVVVPNAVDSAVFHPLTGAPDDPPRAGVLCVGRIEPRKNQLALVRACRGLDETLTIIGTPGRHSGSYAERVRSEGGPNVRFLDPCAPEQLLAHYRSNLVHACVSWYETPGLASLEAGVCGCRLVLTPGGCTREYFGEHAVYADPACEKSIGEAVRLACSSRAPRPESRAWAAAYQWPAAAQRTLEGYELALATGR